MYAGRVTNVLRPLKSVNKMDSMMSPIAAISCFFVRPMAPLSQQIFLRIDLVAFKINVSIIQSLFKNLNPLN